MTLAQVIRKEAKRLVSQTEKWSDVRTLTQDEAEQIVRDQMNRYVGYANFHHFIMEGSQSKHIKKG